MILTRSPYYQNVVFSSSFVTKVSFAVSVQYLDDNDSITGKTIIVEKIRTTSDSTNTWMDISPFINDFYSHKPIDTSVYGLPTCIESRDVLAVLFSSREIDSLGSDLPTSNMFINALEGYGYYHEGQNVDVKNKILLSHNNYIAYKNGHFIVPLACGTGSPDPLVNGVSVPLNFVDNTQNLVKYLIIPLGSYSDVIEVSFDGESIDIEIMEECKYPVKEVQFINKSGVVELIHFYKAEKESISIKSEKFKNAFTNGVSYDVQRHQIKELNKKSNRKTKIETGYLNPDYNTTIQELLESEYIWIDGKPVNITTASLEFKTRIVDKLIGYSLDFEYAYDEINNV